MKTGREFKQAKRSGQNSEGKIRKETHHPPNFYASQQKNFLHNMQRAMEE
jgi:hypothetical protein